MCSFSQSRNTNFTASTKYNISSTNEVNFDPNRLRELPDPIPCGDEMIPDPDSIPLSILNYPPGKKREINFAAYDSSELTLPPAEGIHPMLVTHLALCLIF